jgi:hypothetical protein
LSPRLREPQLRGLAYPHQVILDFGPLDRERDAPLVLALTGWLRFGGGMANVAAAHNPELPFPFPQLEAEVETAEVTPGPASSGGSDQSVPASRGASRWTPIDLVVGAPAGKTKTILVELGGKLPAGTKRLRISAAFELHWDRITLLERAPTNQTRILALAPTASHLHWRGYSEFEALSWQFPLTPDYTRVQPTANWLITPSGWCTKYGPVDELIRAADNALALVAGGDELTLEFAAAQVPPPEAGLERDFFFYSVGWDKDADFHCELGWQVEPLPWHGMDSQRYGRETRPTTLNDQWIHRWNTRWVGPRVQHSANYRR